MAEPTGILGPQTRPNPVLQKLGFTGDSQEFLDKLKQYTSEHELTYGYKPTPGQALADAIEGTVPKPVVYKRAQTAMEKHTQEQAQIASGGKLIEQTRATPDDPDVVKAVAAAAREGKADRLILDRIKEIRQLSYAQRMAVAGIVRAQDDKDVVLPWQIDPSQNDPKKAIPMNIEDNVVAFRIRGDLAAGEITRGEASAQWVSHIEEMKTREAHPDSLLGKIVKTAALGPEQVATALVNSPGGIYELGKAGALDYVDMLHGKAPTRLPKIGKSIKEQYKETYTHPWENPGFIFLDFIGSAGGVTGGGYRLAAGTKALKAGEGLGTALGMVAKRPVGGSFAIRVGDSEAWVKLSDNPARAFVQKWRAAGKQAVIDASREGTSANSLHALLPVKIEDRLVKNANKKVRQVWDRDAAIQQVIDMTGPRELQAAVGWVRESESVLEKVKHFFREGVGVGEQKLIFSLALDDDTPIATQIKATQNLIRDGVGVAADQQAHLDALYLAADLAKKTGLDDLADGVVFPEGWQSTVKPSKRLQDVIARTQEVVAEQQALKIRELGLTPQGAETRVATMGAVFRELAEAPPGTITRRSVEQITTEFIPKAEATLARLTEEGAKPGTIKAAETRLAKLRKEAVDAAKRDEKIAADVAGEPSLTIFRGQGIRQSDPTAIRVVTGDRSKDFLFGSTDKRLAAAHGPSVEQIDLKPGAKILRPTVDEVSVAGGPSKFAEKAKRDGYDAVVFADQAYVGTAVLNNDAVVWRGAPGRRGVAAVRKVQRSFYIPGFSSEKPVKKRVSVTVSKSKFGVPMPNIKRMVPETGYSFTGDTIRTGKIRLDVTNVTGEVAAGAARASLVIQEYKRLVGAGVPKFTREDIISGRMTAIRKTQAVTEELRKFFQTEETAMNASEIAELGKDSNLWKRLSPDSDEVFADMDSFVAVPTELIPPGTRGSYQIISPKWQGRLQKVNFPIRLSYFFTRPGYALNMVGNTGMLLIQQGVHTPVSLYKAVRAEHLYGGKASRTMSALVGSGKIASYIDEAYSLRIERNIAHGWGKLNDDKFRVAALIHEMERRGYGIGQKSVDEFLHSNDPAVKVVRNEAIAAAREAMVHFDNLRPIEKELIKHIIFIYPWMSRSLVWSIDTMLDRPITTDFLAQLGEMKADEDPIWNHAPEWFKRMGLFSIGWNDDGTPKVISSASTNSFQILGDAMNLIEGAFNNMGTPVSSFYGPVANYLERAASGRNDFGQKYEGSPWVEAAKETLTTLPQVLAYIRGGKAEAQKQAQTGAFTLTDRESLYSEIRQGLQKTVLTPGWLQGYGTLLAGGFSPRGVNEDAKFARWVRDLSPEDRQEVQLTLLNLALDVQGEALGKKVPEPVRDAVLLGSNLSAHLQDYEDEHPISTPLDLSEQTIVFLEQNGRLDKVEAAAARSEMKRGRFTKGDHEHFRSQLLAQATGNSLGQWDEEVRAVALFRIPEIKTENVLQERVDYLAKQGLVESRVISSSPEARLEAGREYAKFLNERIMLQKQMDDPRTSPADKIRLSAKAFALDDEYDQPFIRDGKQVVPSILRVAFTALPPEVQDSHKAAATLQSWGKLSKFDKAIVGIKVPDSVQEGWAAYTSVVADFRASNPGQSLDSEQKLAVAKQIESRGATGFLKDFLFSEKSLGERIVSLDAYKKSGFKEDWDEILGKANAFTKAIREGTTNVTQARAVWQDWVANVYRMAEKKSPGFYKEITQYSNVLYRLV